MPSAPPDPGGDRGWAVSGCQDSVGYAFEIDSKAGTVSCWLDIQPQHLNRNDQLHGGFTAMLLDIACGYTASLHYDPENLAPVVTVSLTTQYIAPAQVGRVTATGFVTGGGRSMCYANGELRDSDGALIATATGVFKRISKRPET